MPKLGLYHDADPILLTSASGSLSRAPSGKLHVRKDNLAAVTAPGVTDDSAAGYEVGSTWLDTSGGNFYVCKSAAEGAAVWMATVQSPVSPAGIGTELQYRNGSSFGAITGSSWSGSILDLPSGATLNGTAISVSGHTHSYEPVISAGTTAQYWRGDKSWQTLDKSAVGLGSVENTALSSWAGSANVTTLGTITTGTWKAGAVTIPLGSATAPTLTFTGDTDTGIYSTGSDNVSIGTGGVQRVAINGNGVGIGTTPLNNLHVKAANPTLNLHTTGNNTGNTIINFMHYGDSNSKMTAIAAVPINYYGQANLYFVVRGATTADYDIVADAKLTLTPSSGSTFSSILGIVSTTTPQMAVKYNTSNYYTTSVSSAGAVTFDAVGASAGFSFSDTISCPGANTNSERFGASSAAAGANTVAVGSSSSAAGNFSVAIGHNASTAAAGGRVAIGQGASAAHFDSLVIGNGASSTAASQFMVGGQMYNATNFTMYAGSNALTLATNSGTYLTVAAANALLSTPINFATASDKAFYLGDPNTNGSWRLVRSGDNLVAERRESGSYVTKQTISA